MAKKQLSACAWNEADCSMNSTEKAVQEVIRGHVDSKHNMLKNMIQTYKETEQNYAERLKYGTRHEAEAARARADEVLAVIIAYDKVPPTRPYRGKPITWSQVGHCAKCGIVVWMRVEYVDPYDQGAKGFNGPALLEPSHVDTRTFYTPDGGDITPSDYPAGEIAMTEMDGQTISFHELRMRK